MADPEELSEDSLFDEAVGDAPAEAAAEPAGAEVVPEKIETPAVVEPAAGAEKPAVDDNAPLVPSWRLREINEEKRGLADRLAALEAERANWERQQAQPKAAEPVAKADMPDPLLDPDGYKAAVRKEVRDDLLNDRRDLDLELTRDANTEAFDKAHNEAMRLKAAGDPAFVELSQKMNATSRPGKVLLDWHKDRSVRAEIGGDLAAYKQRQREEALKDPEFRKAAMAAWAAEAQPQSNGRPRVELPPSLNGASRSNAALRSAMNADVDDDALFDQTTA